MERISNLATTLVKGDEAAGKKVLTVTDGRTGKTYEIPIIGNHVESSYFNKMKGPDGEPLRYYDPGYTNTICCVSSQLDADIENQLY